MKFTLSILLISIFCFQSYSQSKFKKITKIDYYKPSLTYTFPDTLNSKKWKGFSKLRKQKIIAKSFKKQQNIKNDTSKTIQLLYQGKKETIKIITKDTTISKVLNKHSNKFFHSISCFSDGEATYEIATLKRYHGTYEITVFFEKIGRSANFIIDTNYSQVYLIPEVDIELLEFEDIVNKNNKKAQPIKTKSVKIEDRILVEYRIPSERNTRQ